MTWWLWAFTSTLVYLAGGLTAARIAFVGELGDSPRLERDYCSEKYCTHFITMVDGERYQATKEYDTARKVAGWIFVGWPGIAALLIFAAPLIGFWVIYDRVLDRPTKAEKLTQLERDLAALSAKAKEMGLPVPEEWAPQARYGDPRAVAGVVDDHNVELAKRLRNPGRYTFKEHAA